MNELNQTDIGDPLAEASKPLKTLTIVIYALQAISLLFGITAIVAIVLNYLKKNEVQGTSLESHFQWQINTFWFCLLGGIIGAVTTFFLVGYLILFVTYVWGIYRIVRGFLFLNEGKEISGML